MAARVANALTPLSLKIVSNFVRCCFLHQQNDVLMLTENAISVTPQNSSLFRLVIRPLLTPLLKEVLVAVHLSHVHRYAPERKVKDRA
jgi:hypothetical protein